MGISIPSTFGPLPCFFRSSYFCPPNFDKQFPPPHAALAQATLKNPYLFDFLSLGAEAQERELEKGLVTHIEKFLLELGEGFAFLGRQYHLQVEEQDFYIYSIGTKMPHSLYDLAPSSPALAGRALLFCMDQKSNQSVPGMVPILRV